MRIVVAAVILALVPATSASAMPVSTFMSNAESLKRKGPLALMSGDLKLLMNQVKADGASLKTERLAAEAAGRKGAFCPPAEGVKLSDKDVMQAMEAVPEGQRSRTSTKDALRAYMARRFPCRT